MLFGDCVGVAGTSVVPLPLTCVQLTDPAITARIATRTTGYCPNWLLVESEFDQVESRSLIGLVASPDPDQSVCPLCVIQRADDDNVPGFNRNKKEAAQDAVLGGSDPGDQSWNCIVGDSRSESHVHKTSIFDESVRTTTDDGPLAVGTRGWSP